MENVKRFDMMISKDKQSVSMEECENGEYVEYAEYEKLVKACADQVADLICKHVKRESVLESKIEILNLLGKYSD